MQEPDLKRNILRGEMAVMIDQVLDPFNKNRSISLVSIFNRLTYIQVKTKNKTMETNNRRDFLKKAALAGASALVAPSLFAADGEGRGELSLKIKAGDLESKLIVPKNNGLKITGTFLDEISHDIPHQNWGEKEWDLDFQHMKRIGIDTVIMIRSGYRKFMTYPSPYLLKKDVICRRLIW